MAIAEAAAAGQVSQETARQGARLVREQLREQRAGAQETLGGTPSSNGAQLRDGADIIKLNLKDAAGRRAPLPFLSPLAPDFLTSGFLSS
jgi:hypothetical protein